MIEICDLAVQMNGSLRKGPTELAPEIVLCMDVPQTKIVIIF